MITPKLTSALFIRDFVLLLSFSDGLSTEVDFTNELSGGIFDALQDPGYFRSFTFKPLLGSIEWSNGADFSPEFLYELAKSTVDLPESLLSDATRKSA